MAVSFSLMLVGVLALGADAASADTAVSVGRNLYTVTPHPRILFDGRGGAMAARLKDPDGSGAAVAPQASDANPAFVALKSEIRACVSTATPCSRPSLAADVLLATLDWYMDNAQAASLAAARHWLGNIERYATAGFGFGCDVSAPDCGVGSWTDWASADLAFYALAYTLIQDQMSTAEKAAFARKMLNNVSATSEDECTNQLRPVPGASATYTAGGTTISGDGLEKLASGRRIYVKAPGTSVGAWADIEKVDGSGSLTLTAPLRDAHGMEAPSVTGATVYELRPWDARTCGLVWMLQNHPYNPRARTIRHAATTLASPITAEQSAITVASLEGLPAKLPYYLSIDGREAVKVTAAKATTLEVARAQLGTAAAAAYSGKPVHYTRTIPTVGTTDYAHSFVIQKLFGYAFIANALADENEAARELFDAAVDDWLTHVQPKNKDMWTGFQQGGSSNFGSERQLTQNAAMTAMLKTLGGSPPPDRSDGQWLRRAVAAYLFSTLPDAEHAFLPWGDPAAAATPTYDSHHWAPILTGIYGAATDESSHWNHWQRSVTAQYGADGLTRGRASRFLPYALMYFQETDPSADYKAAYPLQRAFSTVDGTASHALAAWISRTGWASPSDSLVFATAFPSAWSRDHIGPGAPSAYKIYRRGWLLTENGARDTGAGADTNMAVFGETAELAASRLISLYRVLNDDVTGAYAFVQITSQASYHTKASATRALRNIAHLKKPGTQDYAVVYDTLESWSGTKKTVNFYFDKTPGETSTMTSPKLPSLVWTGPNRRLSTKVVLPRGTAAVAEYSSLPDAHKVAVCASKDGATCDETNLEADFLAVHRPSTNVADAMPAVRALADLDPNFVGVEILGIDPKVVVFPKRGHPQPGTSFKTDHAGTAQVLVTGLQAAVYDVERDGVVVCDDLTAPPSADAIYCELESGKISVVQVAPLR